MRLNQFSLAEIIRPAVESPTLLPDLSTDPERSLKLIHIGVVEILLICELVRVERRLRRCRSDES